MPNPLAASESEAPLPYEVQIAGYVAVVVLTSYTWDWILSIPEEYEILQRVGLNRPVSVYYLSRIFSLGYCVSECIRYFDPSIATGRMTWVKFLLWWLSGSATSLLFLLRIMAVFSRSSLVKLGFTILWFCWLFSPFTVLFGSGQTCFSKSESYCDAWSPLSGISILAALINDTLVFLSISYRMAANAMTAETWVARSRSFFTGEGLYRISKVLLYSGQFYYGVTVVMLIVSSVLDFFYISYIPLIGPAYSALASSMACRVFRMVILCKIDSCDVNTYDIELAFHLESTRTIRASNVDGRGLTGNITECSLDNLKH